ncbi:hypothetical protein BH24BAC1_BH24BAC1_40430 [soil metagenome]
MEKVDAGKPAPAGWLVQVHNRYYTGNGRSSFERWTPFPKFAKVYRRKGWAQKITAQLGGQIVTVADGADVSD